MPRQFVWGESGEVAVGQSDPGRIGAGTLTTDCGGA